MGGGAPNEVFLEISNAGRSESVLFRRAAASICMSTCSWLQNPAERVKRKYRKVKKMLRMRRKAGKRATRWPKAGGQLTKMNFQKLQKLQNASIACGPTALVLKKKVRHVGQGQGEGAHFDIVNSYHADFDSSGSLCR